jgi:hypothetical protein
MAGLGWFVWPNKSSRDTEKWRSHLSKLIKSMNTRKLGSRILILAGSIDMLVGAADPLEGSSVILPGSGLVAASNVAQQRWTQSNP